MTNYTQKVTDITVKMIKSKPELMEKLAPLPTPLEQKVTKPRGEKRIGVWLYKQLLGIAKWKFGKPTRTRHFSKCYGSLDEIVLTEGKPINYKIGIRMKV
jgi:hypothetical protein